MSHFYLSSINGKNYSFIELNLFLEKLIISKNVYLKSLFLHKLNYTHISIFQNKLNDKRELIYNDNEIKKHIDKTMDFIELDKYEPKKERVYTNKKERFSDLKQYSQYRAKLTNRINLRESQLNKIILCNKDLDIKQKKNNEYSKIKTNFLKYYSQDYLNLYMYSYIESGLKENINTLSKEIKRIKKFKQSQRARSLKKSHFKAIKQSQSFKAIEPEPLNQSFKNTIKQSLIITNLNIPLN